MLLHPFTLLHHFLTPTGSVDNVWSHSIDLVIKVIHDHVLVKIRHSSGKTRKGQHRHYPRYIVCALHKNYLLWHKYQRNKIIIDNKVAYAEQAENCKSHIYEYKGS